MSATKTAQAHPVLTRKQEAKLIPHPNPAGTACLVIGCAAAFVMYPQGADQGISEMAAIAARYVGMGFLGSLLFDVTKGLRNLLRTDVLFILGTYALTLAEFLFPQEEFNSWPLSPEMLSVSINMSLLGIGVFAISRHLVKPISIKAKLLTLDSLSPNAIVITALVCGFLGFLTRLISVDFQIFGGEVGVPGNKGMIFHMMGARFSQPWARAGQLGGWNTLLGELALLQYVIPPLFGVSLNRLKQFGILRLAILGSIFYLVMFGAFAGGTRNVFIAHVSTFAMSYLVTVPQKKDFTHNLIRMVLPTVLIFWLTGWAAYHMLEFRTIGLRRYLEYEVYKTEAVRETLAVDYNLASMALIGEGMPARHPYLGSEIIVWAISKPVPRAVWKGKPAGLSVSMEEIAGTDGGFTIAITYIGEAYMFAGWPGIVIVSAFFGVLTAWWNRMAILTQSDYGLVVYALGFFAAGLTTRSFFWTTTAILPVIALVVFRKFGPFK
ncbi:hypothetical protein Lepto7376_1033 [[Leptolyngbya] sp. PCC 7376]|uniref:oligosaccharide repeat unit polymerase n=1 Tax=[Leptolyngbya] sp. PCC 7376 TaxID=111781 RepID=UPI00029F25FB|nr:oligosaccharide repeat unit polymerase [[Leptolyngbya] sp. PCC 7376]AFY37404.1 hypothetical protein Lepto7376_1033 [[Leptolyngbya] sp. PCC 7376]